MARKIRALRKKSEFVQLREQGRRDRQGPLTITFAPIGASCALACAIPKRVGTAVVRNRLRRRIRSVFAETDVAPGMYLVSAAPELAAMTFQELRTMLTRSIAKVTQS